MSKAAVGRGITLVVITVLMVLSAREVASQNVPVEPSGWNREGAAKYLDERMDVWFAETKKLQTSKGETACVSCHTVIPYALARPALRQAMHVKTPTPQEVRLIENVTRRVQTYDAHEPYYDFADAKKVESRGTEAVLNALILASADAEQHRREPSEPTRRAFGRLWETQRPDGVWDWLDFGLEPFESADATYYGASLAALAIGTAPAFAAGQAADATAHIEKLRGYLTERYAAQSLFNRVWLLLAATRWKDLLTKTQRDALIGEVQRAQRDDGGWSLRALGGWRWSKAAWRSHPPGTVDAAFLAKSDGFATGLIVYTLRQAGLPGDDPVERRGVHWLKANQQGVQVGERTHPAWRSHSLNYDREHGGSKGEPWRRLFMSDAATAFAVLALLASD